MKRNLTRMALAGLMALTLALTSLTMAVARGQTRVAGEIVICSGYGMTTISVDAAGHPTGPVHLCPDMVLGMMAALDLPLPDLSRPLSAGEAIQATVIILSQARAVPVARARDPPVAV